MPKDINTGRCDGILYTFGNSQVAITLVKKLLKASGRVCTHGGCERCMHYKFYKITSKLEEYTNGLKTLALIPRDALHRNAICKDWLMKWLKIFEGIVVVEEGQTYLFNLVKARYRQIIIGSES